MLVPSPSPLLAAVGLIGLRVYAQWRAGSAAVAIGAIREQAAAPKTLANQIGIDIVVDQVAGGCDLRACGFARQVAARVGCRGVVLHGVERQVTGVGHTRPFVGMSVCQ